MAFQQGRVDDVACVVKAHRFRILDVGVRENTVGNTGVKRPLLP